MDMGLSKLREIVNHRKAWCAAVHRFAKSQTWLSGWTTMKIKKLVSALDPDLPAKPVLSTTILSSQRHTFVTPDMVQLENVCFPLSKMKTQFWYFREQYQSKLHPEVHSQQYFPHTLPVTLPFCLLMLRQPGRLSWEMLSSRLHYNAKYTQTQKDVIPPLNINNIGFLVHCALGFHWGEGWGEGRNSR